MPGGKRYPAGPLAYVAFGLFVMTWASIRLWYPAISGDKTPIADNEVSPTAQPAPVVTRPAIAAATIVTPPPVEQPAAPKSPAALVLEELATMPMVAEIAPPVATRIEFDPVMSLEPEFSVSLEPALATSLASNMPQMDLTHERLSDELELRLARARTEHAPQVDHAWPFPISLVTSLKILAESPATRPWSQEVLDNIDRLFACEALNSSEATAALDSLEQLSEEAKNVAEQCRQSQDRVLLTRVSFGLMRRLLVWRQIERLAGDEAATTTLDTEALTELIDNVEKHFFVEPSWQTYLLLSQLRDALKADSQTRVELAARVLKRMESPTLTPTQKALMNKPPVTELAAALQTWTAPPVDLARLLDALEELELGDNRQAAQQVAAAWQSLRWLKHNDAQQLADHLNTYYRNANVRVAISGELLNMLMPEPAPVEEPVRDEILGARVFGRSQTQSRLRVVLLPDMRRLRLGVEAIGEVDSDTAATKGPATLYTQGTARFHARKMLSIDRQGLRVWRSQAEVDTDSRLTDIATDFDALPFVGMFARAIARQEHDEQYPLAKYEIKGRVAAKAEHRFDHEVNQQLAEAEREFMTKLYEPLERLKLEPSAVDLRTTREQLIARYRIAGQHQLAAYTPRPAASESSVLNVQLHHSTLNNVLEQLQLAGRRTDLITLYQDIAKTFNQESKRETLDELPENVTVQFAEHDPVRVFCDDGRLLLVIKLAELSQGRERKWKNFTVQGYYVPSYETLDAKLVREGTIELIGERLSLRDQIALRGIFTKVLAKDRTFNLMHPQLASDPRLKSLMVEQFAIDDGWIGLSIAHANTDPSRVAGQKRTQQQK
jgi:hypothetical protein